MSDNESCVRCARRMRREILGRLAHGDTLQAGTAGDRLAAEAGFTSLDGLLMFLGRCDAAEWINLVLVHWGPPRMGRWLLAATGFDRQGWLDMERRFRR